MNIDFSFYEQCGFDFFLCLQLHQFSIIAQILKIQIRFCSRTFFLHKNYYVHWCYNTRGMRLLANFLDFPLLMDENAKNSNEKIYFPTYQMVSAGRWQERSCDQRRNKSK